MKKDWVALIEAGYSLEESDESWIKEVLEKSAPLFDRGWWPAGMTYRYTPTTFAVEQVAAHGPSSIIKRAMRQCETLPVGAIDNMYRRGNLVGTISELGATRLSETRSLHQRFTQGIVGDNLAIISHTGEGKACILGVGLLKQSSATALERKRWTLIASHLGAGLRLRNLAQTFTLDSAPVEAIFDGGGKLHGAREQATGRSAQDMLRAAVLRIDRVRTHAGRSHPDVAMTAWEGLVHGRWSLVDRFDTDGRRFVVAIKNDPTCSDPRGLTTRERQVAEFVGLGQSAKEISYTLGLSHAAVTNCTARAQRKLGLVSLDQLAGFFAPNGLRTKLAEVALAGERLLVGAYPLMSERQVSILTEAERMVLTHVIAGSTNHDIAWRRQTSEHTVAKQVQNIFRKLDVSSRSELAARLINTH